MHRIKISYTVFFHTMITITISHNLDELVSSLHENLHATPKSPFHIEEVIIPSIAMRRYLELAIADKNGICSNIRFSFLARWFWEQIHNILPDISESSYGKEKLTWRIFYILGKKDFVESYPRLHQWLLNNDEVGRFELAKKLAELFEQYIAYRPHWLESWWSKTSIVTKNKEDEEWQAALWRKIEEGIESDKIHPFLHFFNTLESSESAFEKLPQKLFIFCPSSIAPEYLNALKKISKWIDIHIYVLSPYFITNEDINKIIGKPENSLLTMWGQSAQSSLSLLVEKMMPEITWHFSKEKKVFPDSLLGKLQEAVFHRKELTISSNEIRSNDRSIEVHICHSITREIEVLHDQMLSLFASDNPPDPSKILVVTPHINKIAPLVDAVFGSQKNNISIPYRIMGRTIKQTNPIAKALKDIFALATSRFTASDVYDLLLQPLISKKFGLEMALDKVYNWLDDAGICWGFDAKQKGLLGLPADDSRSFSDGFNRLFLSYALPENIQIPFNARLPASNVEGSDALLLGNLWRFINLLHDLAEAIKTPMDRQTWHNLILETLDNFIYPDINELENDLEVRNNIGQLFDYMNINDIHIPFSHDVIRSALEDTLNETTHTSTFSGTVTFSSMSGLKNLPYQYIFAIGMDNEVFPRSSYSLNFDLMSHHPLPGDIQKREEDRNTFLDLILAANKRFYISYTGKSIRNNDPLPPSVVVSELIDYLMRSLNRNIKGESLTIKEKELLKIQQETLYKQLVLEHPLQPFSTQYFEKNGNAKIRSYQTNFYQALKEKLKTTSRVNTETQIDIDDTEDEQENTWIHGSRFFNDSPLQKPEAAWQDISLSELIYFFENPSRYLLTNRLGINFPKKKEQLPENEPFIKNNLDANQLANRILPYLLENHNQEEILEFAKAGNEFPSGMMGQIQIENELNNLNKFAKNLKNELVSSCLPPLSASLNFNLNGEEWTINHVFNDLRPNGLIHYRYVKHDGNSGIRFTLSSWINHLFLNSIKPKNISCKTTCYLISHSFSFFPCEQNEAKSLLEDLLILYKEGLNAPLRFFPQSSFELIKTNENINKAKTIWKGNDYSSAESDNDFYQLALRGQGDILDENFIKYAKIVMEPLHRFMEKHNEK